MADSRITQPSFSAGEISPALYARKDLARYQVGARKLLNCYVHAHGGVSNRAGLRFAAEVKDSAKGNRLTTFEAAVDEAFLLVWGDNNVRPMFRGGYLDDGGAPYEVATIYPSSSLAGLYMEQSNDVMTIVHPLHPIKELARYGFLDWRMSSVTFAPTLAAPTALNAVGTEGFTGYTADKLPLFHTYKVAAVGGDGEESLPSAADTSNIAQVLGYEKNYVTLTWTPPVGVISSYQVYKEENGLYGYIGTTPNATFKDTNFAPSFSNGPQSGANPFAAADHYPSVVTFVQQRRTFGNTIERPQTIYQTQSGNFKNMGTSTPIRDDDAIEFTLASKKKQDIHHIVPLDKGMIVFTRSGEWRVTGRDGDIITPSSVYPTPQSSYGSSKRLKPIIAGEQMLFSPRSERKVLEMSYSLEADKYVANDLTILANHLFVGREIVAWDYAAAPDGIIWCVMSDGKVLSLTYLKEHDVWGWGRHETRGKFLDVSVVPEVERDVPYFIVRRRIGGVSKQYIEYIANRAFTDVKDCFFVDCGLSLDNPVGVSAVACGAQTVVTSAAHGLVDGDLVELANVNLIDDDDTPVRDLDGRWVVAGATADTFRITYEMDNINALPPVAAGDDVDTSDNVDDYYDGGGVFRKGFVSVSGLDHLEGRNVIALCDGSVVEGLRVVDGSVEPDGVKHFRMHIGLSFRSVLGTLDLLNQQADDTGVVKGVPQIFVRLLDTRGIKIGWLEENAVEGYSRDDENYGDPASLRNGIFPIELWGEWSNDQPIYVVQDFPLPMTVLGVTLETVYGGS